ncbi:GumC family protein [Candidatus Nitrotoga arctica]|uniref:Tyr recombinase domain-containing protein n=1 Tax=Candidatus Nitrotoga arctica TaxID=453162 RepID=A0ABM8YVC9_9PROT|nr:tyrosine-type recombinase/integrase [Candidatus Nitrotoga arctica]CAG9931408.1 Tyr recombinase domain-containing protein [Candidatus Nitrotoga arctica]
MFSSPTQRANRRKFLVFSGTFLVLAAIGLFYSYSRPAIYLAGARVHINPGAVQVEAAVSTGGTQGANVPRSLLNELQVLTSRPLVKAVLEKMPDTQRDTASRLGADPVAALQAGLQAKVAEGTDVVEVTSRGPDAVLAATLVNELVVAYTGQLHDAYAKTLGSSLAQISDEVAQLTQKVQTQRRQMEDFRLRHNIVSFEREENEVLGRIKGQTEALNKAQEKLAIAEGKLRAMTESATAGRPIAAPVRANATLENLEQRASQAREELNEMGRGFTPAYLAMDPRARAVKYRLAELERQIVNQRQINGQVAQSDQSSALADARDEVNAARDTIARMTQQASGNRGELQQFASRFNEFRTMRDELAPLESLLRDAIQRNARQEAGEASRRPSVRVVEPAFAPREPWQPQYARDAAIVLGGAFLLALLAMWVVELFNRVDAPPTWVVSQPSPYPSPYLGNPSYGLGYDPGQANVAALAHRMPLAVEYDGRATMLPPVIHPRELLQEELAGILTNASPTVLLFAHLLLRGVSPEEAVALRGSDVNTAARTLHVASIHEGNDLRTAARDIPLDSTLHEVIVNTLKITPAGDAQPLLGDANAKPVALNDLTTELLYAAHDAGVDQPAEVTPDALRHTCAAFLARQGIRMADLARAVGQMSTTQAAIYSAMAPAGKRLGLEQVERLMLAVRQAA